MKKFVVFVLLGCLACFTYWFLCLRKGPAGVPKIIIKDIHVFRNREDSMPKYTACLRKIFDDVFGPLDNRTPNATAQLHTWLMTCEQRITARKKDAQVAALGKKLCKKLIAANREREECESGYWQTKNRHYDSLKRPGRAPYEESKRKQRFYLNAWIRKWQNYVDETRPSAASLLRDIKIREDRIWDATQPSPVAPSVSSGFNP